MRELSDEEIDTLKQQGWVKLVGFISADEASELLRAGERLMATVVASEPDSTYKERSRSAEVRTRWKETDDYSAKWTDGFFQAREIHTEPFASVERAAGPLVPSIMDGERSSVVASAFASNVLMCKRGLASGGFISASEGIVPFHQDGLSGADGVPGFTTWIALDRIAPEQGSMQFLTGSHHEGYLGKEQISVHYSRLVSRYEWSPCLDYQPGDATIHQSNMVHGSTRNVGQRPRWSFSLHYSPDVWP